MDILIDSPDWSLLRVFLAVAESGSLSAAARSLGSSQPTVGRQIRSLEDQLGATLFHRHARGFDLTDTGRDVVALVQAMQEAAHQVSLQAAGRSKRLEGTVRITASEIVSFHHLPKILSEIRALEPRIEIELVPSDDTRNLLFREADIAIRMYRPDQLDLITKHIGDIRLGIFAARRYIARRGMPERAEDLLDHDIIGFDRSTAIIDGFRAMGMKVDRNFFGLRCDNQVIAWQLLRAGAGISFAQRPMGQSDPDLVEIPLDLNLPVLPLWLTAHEAIRDTPRVRRIWTLLEERLRPLVS